MIKLLFAGDLIPPETTDCIYSEELREVLQDKDFSIVNLETPLTNRGNKIQKTGNNFKRSPDAIQHVKDGYFDAVTLSNNHIRDYGDEGVLDTIKTCHQNDVLTVGAGKDIEAASQALRINLKGKKISILNYSEREFNIADENRAGANPFDLIDAFYQIKTEKEERDIVIIVYHGGLENNPIPMPGLRTKCRFLINVGADAIICHHTHVASCYEIFNSKPICYGLGNFCFDYKKLTNKNLYQSLIANILIFNDQIDLKITYVNYDKNIKKIELLDNFTENNMLQSMLNKYNLILQNEIDYSIHWEKKYKIIFNKYYIAIVFGNSFLAKVLKKIKKPFYRKKRLLALTNMFSCDTHSEMIINAFNEKMNY